jgi:hypothetical protein
MTTQFEDLESQFEALVPQRVKDLSRNDPNRLTYADLKVYSREEVEALCELWGLKALPARNRLIKLWGDHPERRKEEQSK